MERPAPPRVRVSYPPKDSPHLQPHHVTMAVAPVPFSRGDRRASIPIRCQIRACSQKSLRLSTSRRFSADESVTSCRRCQRYDALSFLGFVPLQGPSDHSLPTRGWPFTAGFPEWDPYCSNSAAHQSSSARGRARPTSGRGYRRSQANLVPGAPHRKRWALNIADDRSRLNISNRAPASRCSVPTRSTSLL